MKITDWIIVSVWVLACFWLSNGTANPHACGDGQCTIQLPQTKEFEEGRICDLQEQADDTLIYCVFDAEPKDKKSCLQDMKTLDNEAIKLNQEFKMKWGYFVICEDNFPRKWKEAKKTK